MPDYGAKIADKAIDQTAKKVARVYKEAEKELKAKLKDFNTRHKAKQKEMLKKVEDGEITQAAYESWMRGQVFIGKQWQEKLDSAVKVMQNANEEASQIVRQGRLNVFAENYNYSAYQLEKRAKGAVSFNVYNEAAAARLIKDKPKMLPEWKIDQKKDYVWNRKKVENCVTQGIIQGEGIDKITNRLARSLCTTNENRMRTFARTSMTGAQNAGRQAQMKDAEDMGIKVKKRWLATLDSRTRDTHQELDGQEVPVDEPFEVDGMEIMYPGDPNAEPELVYNCRCTMIEVYEGIDRKSVRRDEDDNEVEGMTYKEWKEAKENGTLKTDKKLVEPPIKESKKAEEKVETKQEQKQAKVDVPQKKNDDVDRTPQFSKETSDLFDLIDSQMPEELDLSDETMTAIDNYIEGRGNKFTKDQVEEIKDAMVRTDETLYRVEDMSWMAEHIDVGDTIEFDKPLKSFTRDMDGVQTVISEGDDAGLYENQIVVFETVGGTDHLDVSSISRNHAEENESLVGGKFRVVDEFEGDVNGRDVWIVQIEQVHDAEIETKDFHSLSDGGKISNGGAEPASLRYVNNQELFYKNAGNITPIDGYEDIACHGDKYGFQFRDMDGNESNVSVKDFVEMIRENPGYHGGDVRLIVCEAGADGSVVAQGIADELGVNVIAPSDIVWVNEDGSMTIGKRPNENTGKWVTFKPRRRK